MIPPANPPPSTVVDRLYRVAYRVVYQVIRGYWRLFGPTTFGVQVAVWHDGRLLVLRNSYRPEIGLPGGGLARGETPEVAARRELAEEVGIDRVDLVGFGRIDTVHDGVLDCCHFFEVHLESSIPPRVDQREVTWAGYEEPSSFLAERLHEPLRAYLVQREKLGGAASTTTNDR